MKMNLALFLVGLVAVKGQANSITKIVSQLEDMRKGAIAENNAQTKAHEEKQEWCRSEVQGTGYNIDDAAKDMESADASKTKSAAQIQENQDKIGDEGNKLAQNDKDLQEAEAINAEKEADFRAADKELSETIDTLVRAAIVIRKASGGGSAGVGAKLKAAFTQIAGSLSTILDAAFINTADRKALSAFLQSTSKADDDDDDAAPQIVQGKQSNYESHSTGIIDLLADLKVKASKEQNDLRKEEIERAGSFRLLKQSLEDSSKVATRSKDDATGRLAMAQEQNAQSTADLEESTKEHGEQTKYLADTKAECAAAADAYQASSKDGAAEVEALGQAIEILQGSGDQFKSMGVFMQVKDGDDVRDEVMEVLRKAAHKAHSVALNQLALRVRDDPFGKVKGLIEDMITKLQKQKNAEITKNAWCVAETKESEAKRDHTTNKLAQTNARLEKANADRNQLKEDIANLSTQVADATASFTEATKIRNDEVKLFAETMSNCSSGLDALAKAIAVLTNYYSTNADNAARQGDSGAGVIQFLQVAEQDLAKKKNTAEMEENAAQNAYTKLKNDNEVNVATWDASKKAKEGEVTRLTSAIQDLNNDEDSQQTELDNTVATLEKLRNACTHKAQSFEERSAKMRAEIAGLEEALEILGSAADSGESFLQRRF